jgi:hypothetical protein
MAAGPLLREPNPQKTIGVPVPGAPDLDTAAHAGVQYGWAIALLIVVIVVLRFLRFILSSKPVQILAALAVGYMLYKILHGGAR